MRARRAGSDVTFAPGGADDDAARLGVPAAHPGLGAARVLAPTSASTRLIIVARSVRPRAREALEEQLKDVRHQVRGLSLEGVKAAARAAGRRLSSGADHMGASLRGSMSSARSTLPV